MGDNITWPLEAVARLGAGASGGEGADTSETFAADTTGAPVTVTLPALDGLEDGYLVRVYDASSNASVNNITINDADAAAVDTITEDDGERWLVVVGGAWEVRGYLPGPSGGAAVRAFDTVDDLITAHAAQPLAPGTVWRSDNPLLFGTVEEGQLVPDPRVPTQRVLLSRRVRRLGPVASPQPLTYIEVV